MFPALTAGADRARRAPRPGARRRAGEVLFDVGQTVVPFFVITRGQVEIVAAVRHGRDASSPSTARASSPARSTCSPGRRSLVAGARDRRRRGDRARAATACSSLVQTDAELSEIIMRAFILRRVELIAHGLGDVVLVGSTHCAGTLRVQGVPHPQRPPVSSTSISIATTACRRCSIASTCSAADVPVLICRGDVGAAQSDQPRRSPTASASTRPSIATQRARRGHRRRRARRGWPPRSTRASEGLDVLVIETNAPGGQAGVELEDRELPRLPDRHLGPGAGRPGVRAGAEVRRADRHRQGRRAS